MKCHKTFDVANFVSDIDNTLDKLKDEKRAANRWTLFMNVLFVVLATTFIYISLEEKVEVWHFKKYTLLLMSSSFLFTVKNIILVISICKINSFIKTIKFVDPNSKLMRLHFMNVFVYTAIFLIVCLLNIQYGVSKKEDIIQGMKLNEVVVN